MYRQIERAEQTVLIAALLYFMDAFPNSTEADRRRARELINSMRSPYGEGVYWRFSP